MKPISVDFGHRSLLHGRGRRITQRHDCEDEDVALVVGDKARDNTDSITVNTGSTTPASVEDASSKSCTTLCSSPSSSSSSSSPINKTPDVVEYQNDRPTTLSPNASMTSGSGCEDDSDDPEDQDENSSSSSSSRSRSISHRSVSGVPAREEESVRAAQKSPPVAETTTSNDDKQKQKQQQQQMAATKKRLDQIKTLRQELGGIRTIGVLGIVETYYDADLERFYNFLQEQSQKQQQQQQKPKQRQPDVVGIDGRNERLCTHFTSQGLWDMKKVIEELGIDQDDNDDHYVSGRDNKHRTLAWI